MVKKVPDCFLGAGKRTQYTGLCDPHYLNLSSDYFCGMYTVQTMHKQKQLCVDLLQSSWLSMNIG